MRFYFKWIGYVVLGIIMVVGLGYGLISYAVYRGTTRMYEVPVVPPNVMVNDSTIKRGRHVARIRGCRDCHGENFGGMTFINDPMMGRYSGTNLTSGEGGVGKLYDPEDWARAIRHGVGPDSKPLIFMPSHEFDSIGNRDLGALIAYLESLPPVNNQPPPISIGPMSKFLYLTGGLPQLVSAEIIDHEKQPNEAPEPAVSVEFGEYLATTCTGCHGQTYSGGPIPGVPPSWPKAANITPHESGLAEWTYEEFERVMKTGETPDGRTLNSRHMPWKNFRHMTDTELKALWTYLQNLEPKKQGNR